MTELTGMFHSRFSFEEIGEYIAAKYPQSCFAINKHDPNGEFDLIRDLELFFAGELIGLCCCGKPDLCKQDILDLLKARYIARESGERPYEYLLKGKFGCEYVTDNALLLFMAYNLERIGLLEEGTSIINAWTTELGEMCMAVFEFVLNTKEVNPEVASLVQQNDGYCPCATVKNEETKCPCRAFREQSKPGPCHCGRFVKED